RPFVAHPTLSGWCTQYPGGRTGRCPKMQCVVSASPQFPPYLITIYLYPYGVLLFSSKVRYFIFAYLSTSMGKPSPSIESEQWTGFGRHHHTRATRIGILLVSPSFSTQMSLICLRLIHLQPGGTRLLN